MGRHYPRKGYLKVPKPTLSAVRRKLLASNAGVAFPPRRTARATFTAHGSTCLLPYDRLSATESHWSWSDLNREPSACKADALPIELQPLIILFNRQQSIGELSPQGTIRPAELLAEFKHG